VAWKAPGGSNVWIWNVDSGGNYVSTALFAHSSQWVLQSAETSFGQDLSGDGFVGPVTTTIEGSGSTRLYDVADAYFLYPSSGSPVALKVGGGMVSEGQFGGWQIIGAEQTGSGYQVAWKLGSNVWIWNVDNGGNYVSNSVFAHSSQYALQSAETSFGQDLNGDGFAGPITTGIEGSGTTRLYDVADAYFLYGSGSPVSLKVGGGMVSEGQFGGWQVIAAEQVGLGYQVAWKLADNIWIWNVDSSGNYVSNALIAHGSQWALQSAETGFQQDLNRDGVIGLMTTVIEASGQTRLYDVADAYFIYGAGVSLKVGGGMVAESLLGPWRVIGAEQVGTGYQVALKVSGGDLYTIWTVDSTGNYLSSGANLSGSNSSLQSTELTFQQDLNGDGSIGIPADDFDIDFQYSGNAAYRSYFDAAAARWEQVIIGDLPGFVVPGYGFVDDLLISVSIASIDGAGGILGEAAPVWYRNSSLLPIQGNITFDSADVTRMVADGSFASVVLHEMGHVLGIGSMWQAEGLSNGFNAYFGTNGLAAYRQLGGTGAFVPLETTGGPGTAGGHWSEAVFGNELMTGFISGASNPLSILTIASLQDQGYAVNYRAADPYAIPRRVEEA
jgi:Tryptophan-rich Synechocystis species C-terminal domain/Leishmanolysin